MECVVSLSILQILVVIQNCQAARLPKYRAIAYPVVLDGRDEGTKALKINNDITLDLEPSAILHDEFFIRTYKDGISEDQYMDVEALQKDFYHDEKRHAAVMLTQEDGALTVEGVIGPNLKIRPTESTERSEQGRRAHVIESIEDGETTTYGKVPHDKVTVLARDYSGHNKTGLDDSKYHKQSIYPEVYLLCDSWIQRGFSSHDALTKYMMMTLKVVNIRYRPLTGPRIQFVLRGIEFTQPQQEGEYYYHLGDDDIDGYESLQRIVKFVKKNSAKYKLFDLIYAVTGYDMVANYVNKREESLGGYAFVASVCSDNRVQLGEDRANTFIGIRNMAHEMAHTLGCTHDGTIAEGVLKTFTPNALTCPWEDGYIMSYIEESARSMAFSTCCQYDMRMMSWTYEGGCLHRNDSRTMPMNWLHRVPLPGDNLDMDTQCKLSYPDLRRFTYYMPRFGKQNCKAECYVPPDGRGGAEHHWPMFMIDGTPCREEYKMICLNGYCVRDPRRRRRKAQ
uniref:Putative tick salivary metalloprotease n=1 Tax=Rhipicephalus pulchellus TaxID=72859 RepID=L7LR89_RHIPC